MPVDPEKMRMRQKSSAQMLLKFEYPEELKSQMQAAFDRGSYTLVTEIAATHDVLKREALDQKITMVPAVLPEEYLNQDVPYDVALNDAIFSGKIQPTYFTAEGVEGKFETAGEAIEAYKKANNIAVPDKKRHIFRSVPKIVEQEEMKPCTNHGEVDKLLQEMFSGEGKDSPGELPEELCSEGD